MMYADYFLFSSCAYSLVFIPFMIICQYRYACLLQSVEYSGRGYFEWIGRNFRKVYMPLILICVILFVAELSLKTFLQRTTLRQFDLMVVYMIVVLGVMALVAVIYYRHIKILKSLEKVRPVQFTNRFIFTYIASCALVCAVMLLQNLVQEMDEIIYIIPLLTPLFVPAVGTWGYVKDVGAADADEA